VTCPDNMKRGGPRANARKIPPEVIPTVLKLVEAGHPYTVIGRTLGCGYQTVRKVHLGLGAYSRSEK